MKQIERDEEMQRDYIPLASGYEWQAKGKGSTTRLLCPDGQRHPLSDVPHVIASLEAMVRAQHQAMHEAKLAGIKMGLEAAVMAKAGVAAGPNRFVAAFETGVNAKNMAIQTLVPADIIKGGAE